MRHARNHYISMRGMKEPQLHHDKKQEEAQRASGNEEVLQHVPQTNGAQGSEIAFALEGFQGRPDLNLGESSNGQDSGLQNRVWGFESLLPCQIFEGRESSDSCG